MKGKDGIARVHIVCITDLFLREKYHLIKTDGAFRTHFRSNIACQKLLE
jgi:hypothetical protein